MTKHKIYPGRPPRVASFADSPLCFITFNTRERPHLLASEGVHLRFVDFAKAVSLKGAAVGRYVIMPDHYIFFLDVIDHSE